MQCLFCTPYSYMYGNTKVIPQVSQAHVTSGYVRESVSPHKQPLRLCMRNKILRSAVFYFSYKVSTVACNATPTFL